jgi:hypothetical protein
MNAKRHNWAAAGDRQRSALSSMLEAARMPKRSNQFQKIVTYIAVIHRKGFPG